MSELFNSFPFIAAFLAGILSFLSPCVLPLVPSYISFITGLSCEELKECKDRKKIQSLTISNSLLFIAGFSTVFIMLGASSSLIGRLLFDYKDTIRIVGGILVIFFGFFIAGFLKFDFLSREVKVHLSGKPAGYLGSFLVGITFSAAWTPCIGPILTAILIKAGSEGSVLYGFQLLSLYSLGLALPFLISSLAFNSFLAYSAKIRKYMRAIMIASGLLLIIFGILLLSNNVRILSSLLPDLGINF
ncbi:MAG: cytochrome C biogenesis protein [Nitrospirae bacterium GWC2_42_7]|nr:MAG: cytochrome C biogenesis protein [Nitrospirae bacterium GWC2_42_7]